MEFFGKEKRTKERLWKKKEKLVHRGPDAQGSFVNDSVALGFRRLSIIDLEGGLQPMKSSSQNLTVVFNGEIYNYQELREQMEREKKILFVTRSDTETLVNGLEAYGPAFVEQLRGMFAFAVWNEKKEELMLARVFSESSRCFTQWWREISCLRRRLRASCSSRASRKS